MALLRRDATILGASAQCLHQQHSGGLLIVNFPVHREYPSKYINNEIHLCPY
jgi:hypothetical protein